MQLLRAWFPPCPVPALCWLFAAPRVPAGQPSNPKQASPQRKSRFDQEPKDRDRERERGSGRTFVPPAPKSSTPSVRSLQRPPPPPTATGPRRCFGLLVLIQNTLTGRSDEPSLF